MQLTDFDYLLPEDLIAQFPSAQRGDSRLLDARGPRLRDLHVQNLAELLNAGDLLLFNDTRVIPARLSARKATGGRVELFIERLLGPQEALALIRSSKNVLPASQLRVGKWSLTVLSRRASLFHVRVEGTRLEDLLEEEGQLPLPPYIKHNPTAEDKQRYQTLFARVPGAVAAPTAGLHFTEPLLEALGKRGIGQAFVTLHVGAGTFSPIRSECLSDHHMHEERYYIPEATAKAIVDAKAAGNRIVAVGTTVLRAVESAAQGTSLEYGSWKETQIFIRPGYPFRCIDTLLTNFHLPKSTLFVLVSAFSGVEYIQAVYKHAITERYRFFSYGDAMLLTRR